VAAYTLAIWICFVFTLPETWRPLPGLAKEDKKPSTFLQKFKKIDVLRTFRFFKNINIFLASFFTGVSFMMFYMLNTTFSRTYAIQYHLSSGTVGLCYLPLAAGGLVGSTVGGRLADVIYNKRAAAVKEEDVYPEMRLSLEVIGLGTFLQIAGMIAYGWCIQYNVHMAAGLVSMFIGKSPLL
jgi:predicted MFS family arabinose efflux permease